MSVYRGICLLAFPMLQILSGCAIGPQEPVNSRATGPDALNGAPLDNGLETLVDILPKKDGSLPPPEPVAPSPGNIAWLTKYYDFQPWLLAHPQLPKTAIILTLSGGGLRAATLAQTVLLALSQYSDTDIEDADLAGEGGGTLADHVIAVSAVSGGAMTAVSFALGGVPAVDEGSYFNDTVLKADLSAKLKYEFLPTNWTDRTRPYRAFYRAIVDHAAGRNATDSESDVTYSDLSAIEHAPMLFLNSTDVESGRIFTFGQQSFADLCSDMRTLPLATAVDAAGNFPLIETSVTLRNYRTDRTCLDRGESLAQSVSRPQQLQSESERLQRDAFRPYANLFGSNDARYWLDMRYAGVPPEKAQRPGQSVAFSPPPLDRQIDWIHLYDGGLSDNLGLRPIANRLANISNLERLRARGVERIVLIVVNARSDESKTEYHSAVSPKFFGFDTNNLLVEQSYGPIDRVTALTESDVFPTLDKVFYEGCADKKLSEAEAAYRFKQGSIGPCSARKVIPKVLYPVIIDFDQLTGSVYQLEHSLSGNLFLKYSANQMDSLRDKVKNISTQDQLSQPERGVKIGPDPEGFDDVTALRVAGRLLLARNPCFQAFIAELGEKDRKISYRPRRDDEVGISANVEDYPHLLWNSGKRAFDVPIARSIYFDASPIYSRCYPLRAGEIHGTRFSDYVEAVDAADGNATTKGN